MYAECPEAEMLITLFYYIYRNLAEPMCKMCERTTHALPEFGLKHKTEQKQNIKQVRVYVSLYYFDFFSNREIPKRKVYTIIVKENMF